MHLKIPDSSVFFLATELCTDIDLYFCFLFLCLGDLRRKWYEGVIPREAKHNIFWCAVARGRFSFRVDPDLKNAMRASNQGPNPCLILLVPRPSMCEVRSQSQMRNSGTSSNSQGRKARLSRFPRSQASVQWWFCLGLVHGYTCAVQHGDVLSFGSLPHLSRDICFSGASGRMHILLVREHRFHGCLARNSDRHPNGEDAPGTI